MKNTIANNSDYRQWLTDLKLKIRRSQIKAAVKVNTELLLLYWDLGQDIVTRQLESAWGSGFFERLSRDLRSEFPHLKGFSETNLKYCKRFYLFYSQQDIIRPQLVDELQQTNIQQDIIRHQPGDELENHPVFHIPWGHHSVFARKQQSTDRCFGIPTVENSARKL